jgi:hypothetical protein
MSGDSSQHDPESPAELGGENAVLGFNSAADEDSLFVGMGAICDTVARLTGVGGPAVAVLTSSGAVRELVHATDALAQQIDELQFTLGEGPCLDAFGQNREIVCATLDDPKYAQRWPVFIAEVVQLGVAAVFALPVPGEGHPMGVLELYRHTAGELTEREVESARMCATSIRGALESNWYTHVIRSGCTGAAVEAAALYGAAAAQPDSPFTRSQVHVAAGMVELLPASSFPVFSRAGSPRAGMLLDISRIPPRRARSTRHGTSTLTRQAR